MSETTPSEAQDRKADAEARAADALALRHAAEARKADAEAEAFEAEVGGRRAQTAVAEMTQAQMERERDKYLAGDSQHNVYRFTGTVTDDTVKACMKTLTEWSRQRPNSPIEIIFYSPGGSVTAGLALWDFLQEIKDKGHHLTTVIQGIAASMAGILSQAGDVRVMGKESWLMIHEVSFGAQGKIGEIEDTVDWINKVQKRVLDIFAERSKLSVAQLRKMWDRKNAWLSSDEALAKGLVDEVR